VLSLDQCADQYVLALSPRDKIVGLSMRADDADSRLRAHAAGLTLRRVGLETALAADPDVVVRYWGGDPGLIRALRSRGIRVVTIAEAHSFGEIYSNIRRVSADLDARARGEAMIADMASRLARSADAWRGARAIYLTPGGATAGPGTLIDAILRAAGLVNAETRPGYRGLSLEALALDPPGAVVLGFFDDPQAQAAVWGPGRHQVLQRVAARGAVASLPGALLGCPDAGAAEAVERLAASAPR
jgi:iron complex transport system substrate-binding protein